VKCASPVYGRWGGPNGSKQPGAPKPAEDTAFVTRDEKKVEALAESPIAELQLKGLKAKAGEALRTKGKK
jgi:hypothetical protein